MSHLTPLLPKTARLDRMLLVVLLVGLLVRGTILWQYRDTLTRDDDNSGEIATNLRQQLCDGNRVVDVRGSICALSALISVLLSREINGAE